MVDTLGLEPSAERCAGSIPVPGKDNVSFYVENDIGILIAYYIEKNRHSEVAQLVEQMAVNHWVVGSSPSLGVLLP